MMGQSAEFHGAARAGPSRRMRFVGPLQHSGGNHRARHNGINIAKVAWHSAEAAAAACRSSFCTVFSLTCERGPDCIKSGLLTGQDGFGRVWTVLRHRFRPDGFRQHANLATLLAGLRWEASRAILLWWPSPKSSRTRRRHLLLAWHARRLARACSSPAPPYPD